MGCFNSATTEYVKQIQLPFYHRSSLCLMTFLKVHAILISAASYIACMHGYAHMHIVYILYT